MMCKILSGHKFSRDIMFIHPPIETAICRIYIHILQEHFNISVKLLSGPQMTRQTLRRARQVLWPVRQGREAASESADTSGNFGCIAGRKVLFFCCSNILAFAGVVDFCY
ncbi:hypothetical protein BDA96_01G262100 [Sorghum bicolor]|uniref:Uncharacterized protein n=2 Tax=Sorghum bicolor TaxID=4558 RepID=A0A921UYW3_SORBI|nr:hypothetical protein BDA96_01G262100 [Sorghum bicolor]OQU91778.1 hypothetical protein SORBI_3001G247550 [Sorghum bicolor]